VITIAMSTVIAAGRGDVWRALTSPAQLIRWDERLIELLEPADGYPQVGQRVRWRYRLGRIPVVLRDRPFEVKPPERLQCSVSLGLLRFTTAYTLGVETGGPDRTKLALRLATPNSVPVVGGAMDRFDVRRAAAEFVDARLRALQKWCENQHEPPTSKRRT
jgi:hypothetical protein